MGETVGSWRSCSDSLRTLHHRGPDDKGSWIDTSAGVLLGHVRLSVIDITSAGHQPMFSHSSHFVIVFNGEIYNHQELRNSLEKSGMAPVWRGSSDTETLLAGFDVWGIEATLQRVVGMFALAVWDTRKRALTMARDRLGEKPLYYGRQGGLLLFGSELKALKAHPAFQASVNRDALALFMRHNYIPAPYSIYDGISKLPAGTLVTFTAKQQHAKPRPYWRAAEVIEGGMRQQWSGSDTDCVDQLETLLNQAVGQQMVADVPLGAFLSGGVDSSTVVAIMQSRCPRPVRTFTIGFQDSGYDEAGYAKEVARHLGTDHTELYVTAQDAREVIPRLADIYCEPFADHSQIPTFLVSQMARQDVTVALSGDGGDELFGGYNSYALAQRLWRRLAHLPVGVRRIMARWITRVPPQVYSGLLEPFRLCLPTDIKRNKIGDKLHKGAEVMAAATPTELYHLLISQWSRPADVVLGASELPTIFTDPAQQPSTDQFVHEMMALDMLTYLPDDILCKVDRAAMAVSLETRIPLLDHRVVEFAWRLPMKFKQRDGVGKWVLRQLLYRHVPKELIERPKKGFSMPIDNWLRGPLREWAEELLSESRLRQDGYFNPDPIRRKWEEHLSGHRNWQQHLWNVLMFQAWKEAQ